MSQQQQQQHQLQQRSQGGGGGGVEELAHRLNQMNVYSPQAAANIYCHNNSNTHHRRNPLAGSDLTNIQQPNNLQQQQTQLVAGADGGHDAEQAMDESGDFVMAQENHDYQRLIQDNVDADDRHQQQQQQQQQQQGNQNKSGSILIATNVDSSVFSDKLTQAEFESLFLAYDSQVSFRYLRSFRRVRLDFSDSYRAELARQNLSSFKIGDALCRCYVAQIIKAQSQLQQEQEQQQQQAAAEGNFALNECYLSSANHLNIPKLTKQFLISPPASPPVGWEPVNEGSPCIDVQLLSAMANLVPGKVHEIHQGNESQPGIYVEVCEDPQFPAQQTGGGGGRISRHIPKTPLPVKPSL